MNEQFPGYYKSLLEIQEGFFLRPDTSRRLPAVLDHLIQPERVERLTRELARLTPKDLDARLGLLERCFHGISGIEDHLLKLFSVYYRDDSPLNGCSRSVKIAAAAAIIQAYPYEGLACFNPSIVPFDDPSRSSKNGSDFVMTIRSYGEFHRSSISFRTGWIDAKGSLHLHGAPKTAEGVTRTSLPEIQGSKIIFPADEDPNSLVLYAAFLGQISETWEDIRFTRMEDEGDYQGGYFGTFTSFNLLKRRLMPCVLFTRDFRTFDYQPLRGGGAEDKDLAYFPRKINGRYAVLSRNNGRDLFLMTSEEPFAFKKKKRIASCRPDCFDAHKMGVCAPPLETKAGWLVIYHGVADPGQIYSLSALLLDLEDPSRVIARLPYTLHHPLVDSNTGMLAHILYTCGAVVHEASGSLVLPYAVNDSFCKVGRIDMEELLARLKEDGASN
ncbi:MAG: hypothetical protein KJ645_06900 [Planctomycetes bacterium]|nr:hypothetical protein [Planctomycetota bacterium]